MSRSSSPASVRGALLPLVLFCLALGVAAPPAFGQQGGSSPAAEVPADTDVQELQDLVDTLEDQGKREQFVGRLKTMIEAKRADEPGAADAAAEQGLGAQILAAISERMDAASRQTVRIGEAVLEVPETLASLANELRDPEMQRRWLEVGYRLLAVLAAGLIAEWLVWRLLARPRRRLESRDNQTMLVRSLLLVVRTLLEAVPIASFAAAAYAVMPTVGMAYATKLVAVTVINASLLSRITALLGRAVLSPQAPKLRIPPLADETAGYLYVWLRRVAVVSIYGYFLTEALLLLGLDPAAQAALQKLIGLVVAALVIVFLLQNRQTVAGWLRGPEEGESQLGVLRRRAADLWHILAIVYVLATYGVWALEVKGGFAFLFRATILTLAIVGAARALQHGLDAIIARGFRLGGDLRQRYPGLEARANRYLPTLRRLVRAALDVIAILLVLQVWGAGAFAWLSSQLGQAILGTAASIAVILALALALWEVISAVVERTIVRAGREEGKRSARMKTLMPLLRNAVRIVLIVVVTLIVLSELGVNIAPLLAGAGVIGLAIGFGAQTLVKDVITGVFILVEDSLAVGDWAEAGGHSGEVESMTIRTLSLRDLSGQLHVVPFSEVTSIVNMARDFGNAVIDVGVAYREDTDEVIKLLEHVARDLRADPEWGPRITGDLEVFGINNLGESSVDIRVRLRTKPLAHWGVRREFLRRTKKLFDEVGVEIPFPHRTLYFGVDKDGTAPPARVAMQDTARAHGTSAAPVLENAAPSTTSSETPDADVAGKPQSE